MPLGTPERIGKYDVLDIIGRGGMGIVYKGNDPSLNRLVAIKMMTENYSDSPDQLKRFFREAQSTGSLQHPNIVTVYELGDHNGTPYFVMEYLEGESLDSVIANRRPLHLLEKLNVILAVCQGLSYAHRRGIVHRDIKPGNIMVVKEGGIKIVDFGIAHIGGKNATRTGQILGSISYMSPEQINGKLVDARTDIFATGVVLYQLVTQSLPFEGDTTAATLMRILHEPPPPLKNFLATYPPELESLLLRALAKGREDRYQSADAFALDIAQLQAQLKQEIVARRMQEAAVLVEHADLYKAKEKLLKVLEIDKHHTHANHLLREVQHRIQRQELDEQLRQLRAQAEDASSQEQFDAALGYLDRAITLDKNNSDLLQQRDSVLAASLRHHKLQDALKRAEAAYHDRDLDSAKQAVEEALDIAPNDAHAKALCRAIQRDIDERSRQRQLETYLHQARQEIGARRFTAALEVLKLAETLDPGGLQIRALRESATAALQQERRRRELEAITHEIEDALNRDDYETARLKAHEGLERFPADHALAKLKSLAEKQRQAAERKRSIDHQLIHARKLLEEGRSEELLGLLESAVTTFGPEPRLESLLLIVRENVERERIECRKAELLKLGREALRRKDYDQAIQILSAGRVDLNDQAEVDDLLQFAREEQVEAERRSAAERAAQKAHALIAQQKYEDAITLLETSLGQTPDEELRLILTEARQALEFQETIQTTLASSEGLLLAGRPSDAVRLIEEQPTVLARSPEVQTILETARLEAARFRSIDEAIATSETASQEGDYETASRILEDCGRVHGSNPALEKQFTQIRERRLLTANKAVQHALDDARLLLSTKQYQAAVERLAQLSQFENTASPSVWSDYRAMQKEAIAAAASERELHIRQLIDAGEITRAADLLRQTIDDYSSDRNWFELEKVVQRETARWTDAQRALADGQSLLRNGEWKQARRVLEGAHSAARNFPALREQIEQTILQGAESAVGSDWLGAETLLQLLADLPASSVPEALRLRIEERKQEEFVASCCAEAKRQQAAGDFKAALSELARGLAAYPRDPSLLQLKSGVEEIIRAEAERAKQEKARQEREIFVRDVCERAQQETALERRIRMLEHAINRYPAEPALQNQLNDARSLWKSVSDRVNSARAHEDAQRYEEAVREWNGVRAIYARYPDLDRNIARVTRLYEQARESAKAGWLQRITNALASFEYDLAGSSLAEAANEFADDRELANLDQKLQEGLKRRKQGQKLLVDARKACKKRQWERVADCLRHGCEMAPGDPLIRDRARTMLMEATGAAVESDLPRAEMLLAQAAGLSTDSAALAPFQALIESRKRDQEVEGHLVRIARARESRDLRGARGELERALSTFPEERRLRRVRDELDAQLQQEAERQRQEEELRWQPVQTPKRVQESPLEEESRRTGAVTGQPGAQRRPEEAEAPQATARFVESTQDKDQTHALELGAESKVELAPAAAPVMPGGAEAVRTPLGNPTSAAAPPAQDITGPVVATPSAKPYPRRLLVTPRNAAIFMTAVILGVVAHYALKPHSSVPPALVALEVITAPQDTTVKIIGADQAEHSCVTPNCRLNLAPGNYRIEAMHQGYMVATRPLHVEGPDPTSVSIQLAEETSPSPPPEPARLEVKGLISGAEVFLDGVLVGKANRKGTFSSAVTPGEHQIRILAKNQESGIIHQRFTAGGVVALGKKDFPTPASVPPEPVQTPLPASTGSHLEDVDWQKAVGAPTIESLEEFLEKHPGGIHSTEANSRLEDLYWAQDNQANTVAAFRDYLSRYPTGRYVQAANDGIETLDFQSVQRASDPSVVERYLNSHPTGKFRKEARDRLDDLIWAHTNPGDQGSLKAYEATFPDGKHVGEASKDLEKLTRVSPPSSAPSPPDDPQAVLGVVAQYQKAYQDRSLDELKKIWPAMSQKQVGGVSDFFSGVSSVVLRYDIAGVELHENDATVKFTQSLSYTDRRGKAVRNASPVIMKLKRASGTQGALGRWQIESIR